MKKGSVIAIDGFASTGKSTVAKLLAAHFGLTYMDTGYMFRVISWLVLENGWMDDAGAMDIKALERSFQNTHFDWVDEGEEGLKMAFNGRVFGEELRTAEISNLVSRVATEATVRAYLLEEQRSLAKIAPVVMDGRDIGTVVFPNATFKFFLTANPKIRAQRRYEEMIAKGLPTNFDEVLANVIERDRLDSTRLIAPLKKAEDAIELDTSSLTVEEVFQKLCDHITT